MGISDLFSSHNASTQSQSSTLEKILLRSNDVVATLKDLAVNNQLPDTTFQELLDRSNILQNTQFIKGEIQRLHRTDRWWIYANTYNLEENQYDELISLEAIINIHDDALKMKETNPSFSNQDCIQAALTQMATITPKTSSLSEQIAPFSSNAQATSDWIKRLWFANYVENIPFPFRMSYNFNYNPQQDILLFDFFVPRPRCFSFLSDQKPHMIAAARAYVLRSALVVARVTLQMCKISRVCINGRLHGDQTHVFSMDLNEEALIRLLPVASNPQIDQNGFPQDPALRVSFDSEGWLGPIEPFMKLTDPWISPKNVYEAPDLFDRPCSDEVKRLCNVEKESELGSSEAAHRISIWNCTINQFKEQLSTAEVVTQLEAAKTTTTDIYAIEGFDRVIHSLVDGTADLSNKRHLAEIYLYGTPLHKSLEKVKNIMENEPNPDALEQATEELKDQISYTLDMGIYLDDTDSIYRFFASPQERVSFNRAHSEETRNVILVPDVYYATLTRLARAYNLLGQPEKAETYAQEAYRLSPLSIDATLILVRTLEGQSKIIEATKLLMKLIPHLFSVTDAALAYYRLAYMEWKLGRSDLCAACYQMSVIVGGKSAQSAQEELEELLKSDSSVKKLDTQEEVFSALKENDIPIFDKKVVFDQAVNIASACVNDGIYTVGRYFLKDCIAIKFDDAAALVEASLRSPF